MYKFDFNDNVGDNNKTVRLGARGAFGLNEPLAEVILFPTFNENAHNSLVGHVIT